MGDTAKKVLPILLIIWPYLIIIPFLAGGEEGVAASLLWAYIFLTVPIYVANIVNAFTYNGENAIHELAFWNMLIKLFHILFYIAAFCMALLMSLLTIALPGMIIFTPFIVLCFAAAEFLLMLTGSMYGVNALVRASRQRTVSNSYAVGQSVMHFFFVLDTISAVLIFIKLKKKC
ncbi:MAG: hypothetical protein PUJ55_15540 [Clostridiales bacterium]|nr:hypothetical protein [Roseburia sp.]MDD7638335.1 hypothetical protein [Clostridiales bacterium]MDY4111330.1 hypothetical protein [Roseburia sp.]